MPTIPYDATRKSLFHPGEADDFFQYGAPQSDAALCAEMSRLAYVNDEMRLDRYLARAGFQNKLTLGYHTRGTQLFVARKWDTRLTVVAFRGSELDDPADILTDSDIMLTPWSDDSGTPMGSVHQGFAQVLTETNIASSVKNCLKTMQQPNRILLTGHSLGAALATLMSTLLPSAQLFTFGSPRVGDAAFAQAVKTIAHWRYIDCCDSVTRVPPTVLGYVHVGTRQYFDKDGQWLDNASEDAIKADRLNGIDAYRAQQGFFHGTLFPRELADHAPINYVSAVMGLRPAPCPNHER